MQIASWIAALASAYWWAFATRHESVTLIKDLALQLQCTLRCGLSSTSCFGIEQVQDALIWEVRHQQITDKYLQFFACSSSFVAVQHVSTTDVKYYLAFKIAGQEDLVVAYRTLLPRLAVIQPVYKQLLQELTFQQDHCGQRFTAEHSM